MFQLRLSKQNLILPIIVLSQFCCTSLWFASNGVMPQLTVAFDLNASAMGHLTSAVQFGFISGTLLFSILTIADRFRPTSVFLISAVCGSLFNLGLLWDSNNLVSLLLIRYLTGFFLAGIYPVGMKIAADHFKEKLGKSLGYLVGALVIGTGLPHLLRAFALTLDYSSIIIAVSLIAVTGGLLMHLIVPDGRFRVAAEMNHWSGWTRNFSSPEFKASAFGYFGHMWELYTFWAFVPIILRYNQEYFSLATFSIPLWSFLVIAIGGVACVMAGKLSLRHGPRRIAMIAISISGICCLISPLLITTTHVPLLMTFLLIWGCAVIADSPLFSTMVAHNAIPSLKGTALTIVNCIGFSITIISIQLMNWIVEIIPITYAFMILALGPILGLRSLIKPRI